MFIGATLSSMAETPQYFSWDRIQPFLFLSWRSFPLKRYTRYFYIYLVFFRFFCLTSMLKSSGFTFILFKIETTSIPVHPIAQLMTELLVRSKSFPSYTSGVASVKSMTVKIHFKAIFPLDGFYMLCTHKIHLLKDSKSSFTHLLNSEYHNLLLFINVY